MRKKDLVLLGFFVFIAYALLFGMKGVTYQPDSNSYITPGLNLIYQQAFLNSASQPELARTPGYPLFIALFHWLGLGDQGLVFFQVLLVVFSSVLISLFAFKLTSQTTLSLVCGMLFALNPIVMEHSICVLSDLLFSFGMLVVFLAADRFFNKETLPKMRIAVALGIFLGFLILLRPAGMFLPFILVFYLCWLYGRKVFQFSLCLIIASYLLPLSWSYRNWKETKVFRLSSISTLSQFNYTAAGVLAYKKPGTFNENFFKAREELQRKTDGELEALYSARLEDIPLKERLQYYDSVSSQIIKDNSVIYVGLFGRNLVYTLFAGSVDFLSQITAIPIDLMKWLVFLYTVPGFFLSLLGLWSLSQFNRKVFWLALSLIAYPVLIGASSPAAGARFRLPFIPLTSFLIPLGISYLWPVRRLLLPSIHKANS